MIVAVGINSRSSSRPLWPHLYVQIGYARQVAAGSVQAGDKPYLDRVTPYRKDDRNGCSSCFGRFCRRSTAARRNHVYPTMNQFGCKRRQSIILAFRPAIFDRYILALYISCPLSVPGETHSSVSRIGNAMRC